MGQAGRTFPWRVQSGNPVKEEHQHLVEACWTSQVAKPHIKDGLWDRSSSSLVLLRYFSPS